MVNPSLAEAMHDLVANVVPHVVKADLADRAAVAGKRRRRRARLAATATTIALTAVVVLVGLGPSVVASSVNRLRDTTHSLANRGGGGPEAVTGHPVRIGHQWFIGDLPDRPGPIAGLVQAFRGRDADGWYAIAESGQRWRMSKARNLSDAYPTLSPDGRRIGYLAGDHGPYVIHDLVSGEKTLFPQIGANIVNIPTQYWVAPQTAGFWTADGHGLALFGAARDSSGALALVLTMGGSLTTTPAGFGTLAGWVGNDSLLWLPVLSSDQAGPDVRIAPVDGREGRTVRLQPTTPFSLTPWAWVGATSTDGAQVAVVEELPFRTHAFVRRFSLATGEQVGETIGVGNLWTPCAVGWAGRTPTVPTLDNEVGNTAYVDDAGLRPVAAVEPGLGLLCFLWAEQALVGAERGGAVFGRVTGWWAWWWREIVALAGVVTMTVLAIRFWRGRRRLRRWIRLGQPSTRRIDLTGPTEEHPSRS